MLESLDSYPYTSGDTGFIFIDKPSGMTSHDVVARCRRIFSIKKIGHAGTLDPAATGMLLIGIGRATKMLGHLSLAQKTYAATIRLGFATDTDDATGTIFTHENHNLVETISDTQIFDATRNFIGEIFQVPAQVSAIKINGKRAYQRVHDGEVVEIPARKVQIFSFTISRIQRGKIDGYSYIDVDVCIMCSAGTYIRSIARDIGEYLQTGGHITHLRRTAIEQFTHMHTLEEIVNHPKLDISLDAMLQLFYPVREIDQQQICDIGYGRAIEGIGVDYPYCAIDSAGKSVALLQEQPASVPSNMLVKPRARSIFLVDP